MKFWWLKKKDGKNLRPFGSDSFIFQGDMEHAHRIHGTNGISTYIWLICMVGKYTIHGSYGMEMEEIGNCMSENWKFQDLFCGPACQLEGAGRKYFKMFQQLRRNGTL